MVWIVQSRLEQHTLQGGISLAKSRRVMCGRGAWQKVVGLSAVQAKIAYIKCLSTATPDWSGRPEDNSTPRPADGPAGPVFSTLANTTVDDGDDKPVKSARGLFSFQPGSSSLLSCFKSVWLWSQPCPYNPCAFSCCSIAGARPTAQPCQPWRLGWHVPAAG